MADITVDHMCSTMTTSDQTEAKMAASLAVKDKRVYFCLKTILLTSALQLLEKVI